MGGWRWHRKLVAHATMLASGSSSSIYYNVYCNDSTLDYLTHHYGLELLEIPHVSTYLQKQKIKTRRDKFGANFNFNEVILNLLLLELEFQCLLKKLHVERRRI